MRKNLVLTPLMVALAAGVAFAQDTGTAVLTGRVTASRDDRPLAGVRIRIESPSMLGVRNATTDASGNFRVPLLPNGEYSVTYTLDGYISRKITMRLTAGQTANGSVKLNVISAQEVSVEITAQHTQLDKTDTVVQTSFSTDFLEKVVGRSLNSLGTLAPGLNTTDLYTQGTLSIRGGTGKGAKTLLNGSTITEMYGGYTISTFSIQDLVESVALIQSPVNARYGNTDGGIMTIVTSKGSNTFSGTIRASLGRSFWSIQDNGYARRDGTIAQSIISTNDALSKSYQVSVQGPIWKDHITFAYGATLTPKTYSTPLLTASGQNPDGALWTTPPATETAFWPSSNRGWSQDKVGTFYEDPKNGIIIRKPEMWLYNTPEGRSNVVNSSSYNQFTVFFQITPQHQLEWNYGQSDSEGTNNMAYLYMATSGEPWNKSGTGNRVWNLAYKGIIGRSGVLDVHYGKTYQFWWYGDYNNPTYPIRSWTMASRVPRDGNINNHDFDNYWSNGFVWASATQRNVGTGNAYNTYAGFRNQLHGGPNVDAWDGGGTTATVINYQHILNTNNGSHLFDVGMQSDNFDWNKKAGGARLFFDVPGTIAKDLAIADIYNPRGASNIDLTKYAGKYIVFNVETAMLSDIDPYGLAKYPTIGYNGLADVQIWSRVQAGGNPFRDGWASNFLPRVTERYGDASGAYKTNMVSYYLNDLWTINDYHSLQGGVRIDNFEVIDDTESIFKYSQPTFRFEYKWDIHGNQSRVMNLSWAQFHSMQPAGTFRPMINSPAGNTRVRYWNKPDPNGSNGLYLVELPDIYDLNNYGLYMPPTITGGTMYKADENWKAPISTELQLGLRRNLTLGGFWKATFVYRTWVNDFDFFPGEIFTAPNGQLNVRRYLKNSEGYERKYTGVELEWDYPIFKRVIFGGSYTFNRLMSNVPNRTDQSGANDVQDTPAMNWDLYWDDKTGGRDVWRPSRLINPEHYFKWYLLFDLTSDKIQSSLAFRGSYTSGSPYQDGFYIRYGYPVGWKDTEYGRLIQGTGGNNVTGTAGISGFSDNVFVPINTMSTGNDGWDLNLRYMITVPLSRKIHWMGTIDVSSPFNHRGLGNRFSVTGANTTIVPYALTGAVANPYNVYSTTNAGTTGVWRANDDFNSLYQARQNGRSFSVQTGLRF